MLLQDAQLEQHKTRRYHERLKLLYLLYNDILQIDQNTLIERLTFRTTRSYHPRKIAEYSCKTKTFKNSFFPRTISDWNALPADVVTSPTIDVFLSALRGFEM